MSCPPPKFPTLAKKAFEVECDSRNIAYKDICASKGAAPHELMSCYIIVKYFYFSKDLRYSIISKHC